ncbi:MAG: hypothetical protein GXP38_13300 [Chloroflexi bacterium]|nr:hypothetical protein [Chloroflexota bacterium]
MKRNQTNTLLWSILLLLLGIAGLLYNFGVLDPYKIYTAYAIAALLALAGAAFLIAILLQPQRWAFTIPGFSLISLGAVVYLTTLETVAPPWLGLLFLGGVILGFVVLFLSDRKQRWWALLTAGLIATMGGVGWATISMMVPDTDRFSAFILGALLFGGFAISFLLIYLLVGNRRRFLWALVMTGVLGAFSLMLLGEGLGGNESVLVKLWPVLLIVLGAFLLSRLFTGRAQTPIQAPVVPAEKLEKEGADTAAAEEEPARIVYPEASPAATPEPPPESETLPEDIKNVSLDDPGAALDALLEASQKNTSDET